MSESIYELRPGLKRCAHRMRVTGHQCQLADGHVGRHAWEPSWVAAECSCDCHIIGAPALVCSRCAPCHGPAAENERPAD
jgi:hypothetical protein